MVDGLRSGHPVLETAIQRRARWVWCSGSVERPRSRVSPGSVRQMIQLVLPIRLEMAYQLPFGRSDHSHSGDLIMVHVVLAEERVVPDAGSLAP